MSSTQKTKNDKAWESLFEKYNIQEEINTKGFFIISSTQINEFREARLMTKFDNQKTLPELFKDNNIAILPISSNNYILANFKLYENIPEINTPIEFKDFPPYIESIDYNKINSEAIALNSAYISKIIQDFLDENEENAEIYPTVDGKMSSGKFDFYVNSNNEHASYLISVDRSGIEIDAGYESEHSLALIEAKNVIANDFLIRQLYYPFRLWKDKVSKKVRPIFMQYLNGVFSLYEYEFKDPDNYNSLELIKSKKYSIVSQEEMTISLQDIENILDTVECVNEPDVTFPQADSFDRIISLLEMLNNDTLKTKEEITDEFKFDPRQTDYYFNAGKYLGFLTEDKIAVEENGKIIDKPAIRLSDRGKNLFNVKYKKRQLEYVKAILEHQVFNQVLKDCIETFDMPCKAQIVIYMKEYLKRKYADQTYSRRASTISGWINWILKLYE